MLLLRKKHFVVYFLLLVLVLLLLFFFQAEDGIRDYKVTGVSDVCSSDLQAVAQGWLVFQISNSPFWLGLDAFMGMAPGIVLTLAGGVFADLVDRRRLLIYTQIVSGRSDERRVGNGWRRGG